MLRYAFWRLVQACVAIFGVMTIVFVIMRLAGDPTLLLVPEGASREHIDALRHELGFDRPILVQYVSYLSDLIRLDFGSRSSSECRPSTSWRRVSPTRWCLRPARCCRAWRRPSRRRGDGRRARRHGWSAHWRAFVLTGQSMPTFLSGILLILLFAVLLGLAADLGRRQWSLADHARRSRLARSRWRRSPGWRASPWSTSCRKDYVRAGRARGLSLVRVVLRHVLRNAAIPVVTIAALEIGNLLAGAVIVETVFAWPGIGQLAIQSIQSRDFLVVQAIVLFVSVVYGRDEPAGGHRLRADRPPHPAAGA